ncbi:hypothetical protein MEX01_40210 [Methylorubrum extorquens]|nr:hypothetical protein MEX01_40210 [Methylorubrum extorquens]
MHGLGSPGLKTMLGRRFACAVPESDGRNLREISNVPAVLGAASNEDARATRAGLAAGIQGPIEGRKRAMQCTSAKMPLRNEAALCVPSMAKPNFS